MYDIKESGARIKELRMKKGVTQEQMANDLGVTVETVVDCQVELTHFYV